MKRCAIVATVAAAACGDSDLAGRYQGSASVILGEPSSQSASEFDIDVEVVIDELDDDTSPSTDLRVRMLGGQIPYLECALLVDSAADPAAVRAKEGSSCLFVFGLSEFDLTSPTGEVSRMETSLIVHAAGDYTGSSSGEFTLTLNAELAEEPEVPEGPEEEPQE